MTSADSTLINANSTGEPRFILYNTLYLPLLVGW